jgi:hypothetical protein
VTSWQYVAIWDDPGSSPEDPHGLARLLPGSDVYFAEALTSRGVWRRTPILVSVRSTGDPQASEISRTAAVAIATRWYATGVLDEIPDDLRDDLRDDFGDVQEGQEPE